MTLTQQIAEHLNWTVEQVQGFSFQALRDIVTDKELKAKLTEKIQNHRPIIEGPVGAVGNMPCL